MEMIVNTKTKVRNGQRGHTRAVAPVISLHQPGRLRIANIMALCGISHSTLYQRLRDQIYPKPDGFDGRIPFWKTTTIKEFLEK